MSQTVEQMQTSLERLFTLQYFKDAEKPAYVQTIYEGCSWMDAYRFDAVVKEICKKIKTNQRQKPAHFIEMYKILSDQHGWHRHETRICASCGGIGFVRIWLRDKKGREFQASKGCAECNSKYDSIHPDFIEIQEPASAEPPFTIDRLRKIPPTFAQLLLDTASAARINLKDGLVDALCEAAAQPDAKSILPLKGTAAVHKRNEMILDFITKTPPVPGEAERKQVDESPVTEAAPIVAQDSPPSPLPAPKDYTEEDLKSVPF